MATNADRDAPSVTTQDRISPETIRVMGIARCRYVRQRTDNMSANGQTWLIILNKVASVLRLVTLCLANQARGLVTQTRNVNTASIHTPSNIEMTQSPYIRTLLQVDDNLQNTDLITQLIARRSDLKLLTATSGHQGIEMACSYLPDVILMDIKMPRETLNKYQTL